MPAEIRSGQEVKRANGVVITTIRLFSYLSAIRIWNVKIVVSKIVKLFDLESLANQPLGQELCLGLVI